MNDNKYPPWGTEHFSSFQEFETQLALGTISDQILGEIADDDESPKEYIDLMYASYISHRADQHLASYDKRATDAQLIKLVERAESKFKRQDIIERIADRKYVSPQLALRIISIIGPNPIHARSVYDLVKKTQHPDVCIAVLRSGEKDELIVSLALLLLWERAELAIISDGQ